jgi:hypothetical protein
MSLNITEETVELIGHIKESAEDISKNLDADDDWAPCLFFLSQLEDVEAFADEHEIEAERFGPEPDGAERTAMGLFPLGEFMDDPMSKQVLADVVMPQFLQSVKARVAAMVTTSWIMRVNQDKEKAPGGYKMGMSMADFDIPERSEELTLFAINKDGQTELWMCPIARREATHPLLGHWELASRGAQMGGQMLNGLRVGLGLEPVDDSEIYE